MAFSLHAFASSTPATYSALTNFAPTTDPVLAISGNFLYIPTLNNLIGCYGLGANLLRIQLSTPSLLADVPYDVTPLDLAASPSLQQPMLIHPLDPIALVVDEPLQCLETTSGTGATSAFIFLADGALTKVSGRIIRVRATFTSSSTGYTWQNSALTLVNQLAEGTYDLVGARFEGDDLLAARFVFPGGTNATRPGAPASTDENGSDFTHLFRNGNLGVWGTFSNRVLPTVDSMSDGTGETVNVILDVIKH